MSKFTFAFIALMASIGAALSQSCGQSTGMRANRRYNDDERIVGGVEARPNSHPWIVSLQQGKSHFCGGTLVRVANDKEATDIVVTAAHCVYDLGPYSVRELNIVAGAHDFYAYKPAGVQTVKAVKAIHHEDYNPDSTINDIAVIVLDKPINFTSTVQPACLPAYGEEVPENTEATVAGWGLTREGGYDTASILMQVGVPVMSSAACQTAYKKANIKIDRYAMLCAGFSQGGKDACQGDSGGPFVVKSDKGYVLQGVVSFGIGCARPGMPGVYARVSEFTSWLSLQITRNSKVKYN
jgi:transmembrane serine protease 3